MLDITKFPRKLGKFKIEPPIFWRMGRQFFGDLQCNIAQLTKPKTGETSVK